MNVQTPTRVFGLMAGMVVWCDLDPVVGREQGGRRPMLVISSYDYSEIVPALALAVPCTTTERAWPNHVLLTGRTGLTNSTFAMTEQPRTISIERVRGVIGQVDEACLSEVCAWVHRWHHDAA